MMIGDSPFRGSGRLLAEVGLQCGTPRIGVNRAQRLTQANRNHSDMPLQKWTITPDADASSSARPHLLRLALPGCCCCEGAGRFLDAEGGVGAATAAGRGAGGTPVLPDAPPLVTPLAAAAAAAAAAVPYV